MDTQAEIPGQESDTRLQYLQGVCRQAGPLPTFRTEVRRPFQHTGVDFAGPLIYMINKNKEGKAYILKFTCAVLRAVHLEVTRSQTVIEFQRKLNAFITRRTRPQRMISDNAAVFKTTADWIRKLRRRVIE